MSAPSRNSLCEFLRNLKGLDMSLAGNGTILQLLREYLLTLRGVKGEIAFQNALGFQPQMKDLHLKHCILGKTKNKRMYSTVPGFGGIGK